MPGLPARHQVRGGDPHHGRLELLGQPPLLEQVGPRRVAVEHHDRRAQLEPGDERVPHHPRGRREPQQPSAGLQVPAEPEVLAVLDQLAAVAVDDRLRKPGGARGEQDVQRMVERDRVELERSAFGGQVLPGDRVRDLRLPERDPDHVLDRRDPASDRLDLGPAVDVAVTEAVAADREQHPRLDLREPVDDAAGAELGRAGGPDRSQARGGDEADQRLRDIRQVRHNPVTGAHAQPLEPRADAAGSLDQIAERQLERRRASASAPRRRRDRGPPRGRPDARRSSAARP